MTKKFIISYMAVVVFVGLAGFAYAQDTALPPSDSKVIVCPDGQAQMIRFDQDGKFLAAYYGYVDGNGLFVYEGTFEVYQGYVARDPSKTDPRFIIKNETTYFCGSLGGAAAGVWLRR